MKGLPSFSPLRPPILSLLILVLIMTLVTLFMTGSAHAACAWEQWPSSGSLVSGQVGVADMKPLQQPPAGGGRGSKNTELKYTSVT